MTSLADGSGVRPSIAALGLESKRILLAASSGGHLAELVRVIDLAKPSEDSLIVTFDTPQARSLRDRFRIRFIPYIEPREIRAVLRSRRAFADLLDAEPWNGVLSTGAAIALSALPAAGRSTRSMYVESYGRFDGPSLTGRVLRRLAPSVELYTQHRAYADRRWAHCGSILDGVQIRSGRLPPRRPRVFVTLGTIAPYRFDALVDRVLAVAPPDAELVWQLGSTTRDDLPGEVHRFLNQKDFLTEASRASVVISHGGVGSALELIEMGHRPVLVPRRADHQEHVDNHQKQIVADLQARGLVVGRGVDQLRPEDLATTD